VALIRDITERKQADRKLLQSRAELVTKHEELKALFLQVEAAKKEWERTMDCIGDMVMLIDSEGKIKRYNKAVQEFSGCSYQNILGRYWTEFLDECGLKAVELYSPGLELYHEPSKRWFVFNSYPFTERGASEIAGIVISILDITGQKRTEAELAGAYRELKDTHGQLLQNEKMASIGQLAAGVAHEINNPIGFVSSNLGTLDKYITRMVAFISLQQEKLAALSTPELLTELAEKGKTLKLDYIVADAKQLIRESLEGTERVRKIVQDLKTFSRVDEADHKFADINACLESTINIVWNEIKYKATLNKELGEIPQTKCYPQQLNQVFINLLVNAAHAIEKQGEITVRTWHEAGFINISVSDTGCGIPVAHLTKIFEPFFTTKEVGKGTGLGLSISYDIVKKHGGEIQVCSEVGQGTTFAVKIPVVEGR
jgi:two-component system NtrC family sensor kinase